MVASITLVAVGSIARAPLVSERTLAAPEPVEALLVGDSMMHSMAQPYGAAARQLLGARHTFVLDTAGCRRLVTTSCRLEGSSVTPTNAITAVRAHAGAYDRALVVAVGYNDSTTGAGGLDGAIDTLVAEARAQGVEHVVWLTYREAGPSAGRFRVHNALLRTKASSNPALVIADWAGVSARLPSSWFSGDGIHLGADAAKALADLIADTLDGLPPVTPPASPCHIADAPLSATSPVAPGTGTATVDGPASAVAASRRLNLWCP